MLQRLVLVVFLLQVSLAAADIPAALIERLTVLHLPLPSRIEVPVSVHINVTSGLQISSWSASQDRLWLRVRCVKSLECRPFFATLFYSDATATQNAVKMLSNCGKKNSGNRQLLVASGSHAVLVLRGTAVTIRVPVRTLQPGALGDRIRVRDDRKRMYLGTICGRNLLEAQL